MRCGSPVPNPCRNPTTIDWSRWPGRNSRVPDSENPETSTSSLSSGASRLNANDERSLPATMTFALVSRYLGMGDRSFLGCGQGSGSPVAHHPCAVGPHRRVLNPRVVDGPGVVAVDVPGGVEKMRVLEEDRGVLGWP